MTSQRNAAGGATPTAPNDLLRSTSMVPHADTAVEGIVADDYIAPGDAYGAAHGRQVFVVEASRFDVDAIRRAGRQAVGLSHWGQDADRIAKHVEGKGVHVLARSSRVDAAQRYVAALDSNARRPLYARVVMVPDDVDIPAELDNGRGLKDVAGRPVIRGPEMETGTTAVNTAMDRIVEASLDRAALAEIPPPVPLIEGLLFRDSLARLVGPPGTFKTFLALDMAMCLVTGKPWHGRAVPTRGGKVLLLVGEGLAGINARIAAWETAHNGGARAGFDADGDPTLEILPLPMNLAGDSAEVLALIEYVADGLFDLVIVDTQARFTAGAEENSAADMGLLVGSLDRMRRGRGACVMVVHHTTRGAPHGRGSTAVLGALETEISLARGNGDMVTLSTTKQKNAPEADDLQLALTPVGDSLVVRGTDEATGGVGLDVMAHLHEPLPPRGRRPDAPNVEKVARHIFETYQHGDGATRGEIRTTLKDTTQGTAADTELRLSGPDSSFRQRFAEAWAQLEQREWIVSAASRERYLLDDAAVAELGYADEDEKTAADV